MNEEAFRDGIRERRGSETALQRELLSSVSNGFNPLINTDWSFNQHDIPQTFKMSSVAASGNSRQHRGLVMQVRTYTWASDSHGLFDYESRNVIVHDFKCGCMQDSYQVCSVENEIRLLSAHEAYKLHQENVRVSVLAELTWSSGSYYLCPPKTRETNLWLAVRQLRDRSVAVTTGDVLKLGRFRIKVKEAALSPQDIKTRLLGDDDEDCETEVPATKSRQDIILEAEDLEVPEDPRNEVLCNATTSYSLDAINWNSENIDEKKSAAENTEVVQRYNPVSSNTSTVIQRICRICLCDSTASYDSTPDCTCDMKHSVNIDKNIQPGVSNNTSKKFDPLIAPCDCKGSLKWVHLECLRQWMAGRLNIQNETVSIYWRYLECELCKASYPTYVEVPSRAALTTSPKKADNHPNTIDSTLDTSLTKNCSYVELYELPRPQVPYAILTVAGPRDRRNRGFYIVRLQNQCVARLGRGHEADVRVSDISVSRLHALLKFQSFLALKRIGNSLLGSSGYFLNENAAETQGHGCFILEDNRSKFGTLLELKQPVRLEPNFPALAVQVYRTVVTISLKKKWRFCIPGCLRYNPADIYVVYRSPAPTPLVSSSSLEAQRNLRQNNETGLIS